MCEKTLRKHWYLLGKSAFLWQYIYLFCNFCSFTIFTLPDILEVIMGLIHIVSAIRVYNIAWYIWTVIPGWIQYSFCGYLLYVCFGCLISQCHITKRYLLVFGILATGSVIWIFTGCHDDSIGYKHLAVCMMAFFIFVAFSKLNINGTQVIQTLSSCTWGIYLLHPLFINFTIKLLNLDVVSSYPYLKMTFLTIIIFMISFASTFVLRKIPLIKKLFWVNTKFYR